MLVLMLDLLKLYFKKVKLCKLEMMILEISFLVERLMIKFGLKLMKETILRFLIKWNLKWNENLK